MGADDIKNLADYLGLNVADVGMIFSDLTSKLGGLGTGVEYDGPLLQGLVDLYYDRNEPGQAIKDPQQRMTKTLMLVTRINYELSKLKG
jgi:hypothetical protein